MTTPTSPGSAKPATQRLLAVAGWAYILLAVAYVFYGMVTETGLYGYLMDLSLRLFGSAGQKSTFLVSLVVTLIPMVAGIVIWAKLGGQGQSAPSATSAPPEASADSVARARSGLRATRWIAAAFMVLPWVLGYPAYSWLASQERADAQTVPQALSIEQGFEAPAPSSKFVRLEAQPQLDLTYSITKSRAGSTGSGEYYIPLTAAAWTPKEPLRYFLHFTRYGEPTQDDFAGPFIGKVSADALPTPAVKEYERAGIALARPYFVVSRIRLEGDKPRDDSEQIGWAFVIIAAVLAAMGPVVLLGGWLAYRARVRKLA